MTQRNRIYWFAAYGLAMNAVGVVVGVFLRPSFGVGICAGFIVAVGAILLDIYAPK